MGPTFASRLVVVFIVATAATLAADDATVDASQPARKLERPLIHKLGTIDTDMVETQPIVFSGKLYRFESVRTKSPHNKIGLPYFRFIDVAAGKPTPAFAEGRGFGCAYVDGDTMYVFGTPSRDPSTVDVFWSTDLTHWDSAVALKTDGWKLFNTSVCKADDRYIMAFEVGAPPQVVGRGFTSRFAESKDLKAWTVLPEPAVFTKQKYSACPTIRFVDGWYYLIYLEAMGNYQFNPFLVRTRDLVTWQASPMNPLIHFNEADKRIGDPALSEQSRNAITGALNRNNSDWDYCDYKGRLIINYSWGDQVGHEFLAEATYQGTLEQFLEACFPAAVKDASQP